MSIFDPFLIKALIAGIGVAIASGPLGCFIAWRRMAYFGDAVAHAALLGVALALLAGIDLRLGIIAVALLIAAAVTRLEHGRMLAVDTLLGMAAHGALALGLVIIALSPAINVDINGLLFGDILAVDDNDIALIWAFALAALGWLVCHWRNLMRLTLHPDIAEVEGVPARRLHLVLMLVIALAVAVAIKVVGVLLITSLLIIPAAAARSFARTPTAMAALAALAGILSVAGGLLASLAWDTPSGPSIILAAMGIFAASFATKKL